LSQTGTQETARAVSGSAQHGAVREPHHSGGNGEEDPMGRVRQGPQRSGTPGSQREKQLSLESDMGEFIGNNGSAEDSQALAIRRRFKGAVIDLANQFSAAQDRYIQLQSGESPYQTKNPIGPVSFLERYSVILHESPQQRCMTLLLSDEQFKYSDHVRDLLLPRETLGSSQECPSLRAFAELKRCDGARNELPFIGLENIGKAARNPAPVPGVMFEVIQPDFEISRTHAATLPIAYSECERSFGYSCEGIRANCGGGRYVVGT
jgi:hypothetical protein